MESGEAGQGINTSGRLWSDLLLVPAPLPPLAGAQPPQSPCITALGKRRVPPELTASPPRGLELSFQHQEALGSSPLGEGPRQGQAPTPAP